MVLEVWGGGRSAAALDVATDATLEDYHAWAATKA